MKQKALKFFSFLIIVPILMAGMLTLTQCDGNKESDGDEPVICTEVFMTIGLTLKYPDGQAVLLDSCKVFWKSENRFLEQDKTFWNEARVYGNYTIVNDMMQEELKNKREIMKFTGYLNDEIIHEQEVLVGADRCHVKYLGTESLNQIISH